MSGQTTFAQTIKAKLCRLEVTAKTAAAFGCGLFFVNAGRQREYLLRTEFHEALRLVEPYYRAHTGHALPVVSDAPGERRYRLTMARDPMSAHKKSRRIVTIRCKQPRERSEQELLSVFGLWSQGTDGKITLDDRILQNEARAAAFLRGLFIARGIVNPPEKEYHLEFFGLTAPQAEAVSELLVSLGFACATTCRSERYAVYFKDGEQVEYLLALLGDNEAMFEVANQRIARDLSNQLNRQMNCDVANLTKSKNAAARQIEDIRLIYAEGGEHSLPDALHETAQARLANEDASLAELSRILGVGRSGVNHRLEKLSAIAEELRQKRGNS